jgi:hypothetical protein
MAPGPGCRVTRGRGRCLASWFSRPPPERERCTGRALDFRTAPLSGELAPVLGADHEGNDELGGKTVYEADYQELSDGSREAGQDTSGCSSADNVSIIGLSQSINPGVLCSDTVLVVMMNNGSYLHVAYSKGKPAAFVTLEDTGLLWEGLAMAFGYPNSMPVSSDGNGLGSGGARL